jgi:hypothetical protein
MYENELARLKGEFQNLPVGADERLTQIRNEIVTVIELALPEARAIRFIEQVRELSFEPIYFSQAQYDRNREPAWLAARGRMVAIIGSIEHSVALQPIRPALLESIRGHPDRGPAGSPTAISYVRGYRDDDVRALAAELRDHGVPCELDIYQNGSPDGGWSRFTVRITKMPFVIVVCSQVYYERYALEDAGGGGGVTLESGLLSQRFAEAKGHDHGIIPVAFDEDDIRWRPEFLRDETYYILPRDYDALHAALTNQQLHEKPSLGPLRRVVPIAPKRWDAAEVISQSRRRRRLMLVHLEDGAFVVPYCDLTRDATTLKVTLLPDDAEDAGHIAVLRHYKKPFGLAWNFNAAIVRKGQYRDSVTESGDEIELDLNEEASSLYGSWVDMAYDGISADQLALMRARRILLDERLSQAAGLPFTMDDQMALMLESFVAGRFVFDGALTAKKSPLPMLAGIVKSDADLVDVGRLWCVLLLRLTGTIERIIKLDLERVHEGIRVEFAGYRAKVYDNVEPTRIDVSGICVLS